MLSQKLRTCRLALLLCLGAGTCAALAGCGQREKLVPVEGTVFFKDKPLRRGVVTLVADSGRGNRSLHQPAGQINAQGNYKVFTNNKPGAPPGWYNVWIDAGEEYMPGGGLPKSDIPRRYNDPGKAKVAVEVRDDAPAGSYDLRLQP